MTNVGLWPDNRPIFNMMNGPFRRQTSFETTRTIRVSRPTTGPTATVRGDVRIVVETDGQRRWTFRDPQDRVVREYLEQGGAWSHERELV